LNNPIHFTSKEGIMFKVMRKMSPNFTREKSFCIKRMAMGWFLLAVVHPALASAQVSELWVARYHGSVDGSNDGAGPMALDNKGNIYVTGQSQGAGTGIDYATVAYDPKGNQLWVARYNGPSNDDDNVTAIAVDSKTGHVYVTGYSEAQFATVAYDLKGNQLWVARLSASNYGASGIAVDSKTGHVFVTGGWTTVGYDSNGNQLWVVTVPPDPNNHTSVRFGGVAADSQSGTVYVTGAISYFNGLSIRFWTAAYDQSGSQLWVSQSAFGGRYAEPLGVAMGTAGTVYITGYSADDMGLGTSSVTVGYGGQSFFGEYHAASGGYDVGHSVAVDNYTGNVYVGGQSGTSDVTVAYDSRGKQLWVVPNNVGGDIAVDSNTGNVYVTGNSATAAYDSLGNQLWVEQRSSGSVSAIAVDSNTGNVIVTGRSQGSSGGNDFTTIAYSTSTDTIPPVTVAIASPGPNSNGWNNTNVTVTLNSTDSESGGTGVKQIQYAQTGAQNVDTQTVPASAASVTVSAEGTTTLSYFGTDNAGNAEQSKALTVQIDKTPPVVSGLPASGCTLWPPNNQMVQVATITAADALSGLVPGSFQLTGSSNEPSDPTKPDLVITPNGSGGYAVQLRAARLGSGTGRIYTLQATAMDLAGNTVTSTAACTVPHGQSAAVAH
jgi:beta-propeller repeat-containing protein